MFGCDEQLLTEVSGFRGAVGQKLQHPFHQLLGILPNQVLTEGEGGGGGGQGLHFVWIICSSIKNITGSIGT